MRSDAPRSDDQLDVMLAALDENSAAPADSTIRSLHAELAMLADDLRQPLPADPHADESALHRALKLVQEIGRDPSPHTINRAGFCEPGAALGDVGPYRLLAELGQGGMGTVYKALHTRLEKVVALKVLPADRVNSAEARARFDREMKAVGQLDHQHIVRATDAGEAGGTHYLVMEHVEGTDLSRLLKRTGPLPVAAACELVRQAALGLQAAHSRGLVHRDVKPANLMLARQEFGPPVVKVLDLGLALLSEAAAADATGLTGDGHIMGTIDYMAPEQAGDSHAVDIRADIYSLGATLYALLSGSSIFHGGEFKTVMQKLSALATQSAAPLGDRRPDVPAELAALVHRMLSRDPAERPATPADVAAALEPFAAGADLAALLDDAPAETAGDGATGAWETQQGAVSTSRERAPKESGVCEPVAAAVDVVSQAGAQGESPVLAESGSVARRPPRRRPGVIAAALVGGIVLLGAILLSLRTPHGEVVVELGDDVPAEMAQQLKIEVRGDGTLKIADADAGWTIDVMEGKYTAQLTGGNDRLQLDREQVTVTRGGKAYVRVTLKGADAAVAKPAVAGAPGSRWTPTAEQQAFFDAVAKLEPAAQVEAVRKKLMEANPGFDGKLTQVINAGRVVGLDFITDEVTSIWPVRALDDLAMLICNGSGPGKGKLSDLSPVQGMKLTRLTCWSSRISDLSPLQGMRLTYLNCYGTRVSDLSPLQGMPLTDLDCGGTRVSDLSPLQGMPLTSLNCAVTGVSDFTPLQGMPLTQLHCEHTRVSDLSPLKGLVLTVLNCDNTRVSDLSPLRGMPLTTLSCRGTRVSDLSPLKGLPLTRIHFNERLFHAADETLLRSLPSLTNINFVDGQYGRWQPASEFWKGFAARREAAEAFAAETAKLPAGEKVAAVVAKLKQLNDDQDITVGRIIEDDAITQATLTLPSKTRDVAPLRAFTKLEKLTLTGGRFWLDISAINSLPLEELTCTDDIALRNAPVLRGIETLKTINGRPAAEYLDSLKPPVADAPGSPSWSPTAEQQAFFDAVAKLEAEAQVEAVREKLMEVNTGFDGKVTQVINAGRVIELDLISDEVTSIWPVRALADLVRLSCRGGADRGKLSDLSPLQGMPLIHLHCGGTAVSDLSPLQGMSLTWLDCAGTRVSDLSPLQGMPLTTLNCYGTRVSDLSPLQGMPLTDLGCGGTRVSDLSPLQGLPLTQLNCGYTRVSDLSPLQGMPLTYLNCDHTAVTDLSPLRGMPLTWLSCYSTRVSDLSPLQGMALTRLHCGNTLVSDLSPLKGMPLTTLHVSNTRVSDLSPLQGMPLTLLNCDGSGVSDLTPLRGAPLTTLHVRHTRVSDLSPLAGMQRLTVLNCSGTPVSDLSPLQKLPRLTRLICFNTQITDLSPLKGIPLTYLECWTNRIQDLSPLIGMPLEELWCDYTQITDFAPLRRMLVERVKAHPLLFHAPHEQLLRDLPITMRFHGTGSAVEETWKEVDARREAIEQFARETSQLAADEQVAAVVGRLKELNRDRIGPLVRFIEEGDVVAVKLVLNFNLDNNNITYDVTALRAFTKLKKLTLTGGSYGLDISAINSLPLEELNCTADIALRNAPVLRGIETLKTINGRPAAEYLDSLTAPAKAK